MFGRGAVGVFVGNMIGGLVANPLSPFSRKHSGDSEENTTESFDAAGLGRFDTRPISPFSRNVAIAFTENATESFADSRPRGVATKPLSTLRRRFGSRLKRPLPLSSLQ